jgi:hypothetical protein
MVVKISVAGCSKNICGRELQKFLWQGVSKISVCRDFQKYLWLGVAKISAAESCKNICGRELQKYLWQGVSKISVEGSCKNICGREWPDAAPEHCDLATEHVLISGRLNFKVEEQQSVTCSSSNSGFT